MASFLSICASTPVGICVCWGGGGGGGYLYERVQQLSNLMMRQVRAVCYFTMQQNEIDLNALKLMSETDFTEIGLPPVSYTCN